MRMFLGEVMSKVKWFWVCGVLSLGLMGPPLAAQDSNPQEWNAAVNYWQAFGLLPVWTEEEKKLRESLPAEFSAELPEAVKELTERSGVALAALELANRIEKCDWQLDYSQGPSLALPHIQEARELHRQANLRARYRFSQADHSGGVADILASLRLSRAIGKDQVLISLLVQAAIERGAIDLAAAYLPYLPDLERRQLAEGWERLRASATLGESLGLEKKVFGGWLQAEFERAAAGKRPEEPAGDFLKSLFAMAGTEPDAETRQTIDKVGGASVAEIRKAIEGYLAKCDEMIRIAKLDFAQRRAELEKFERELKEARAEQQETGQGLSLLLLPAVAKVADSEEAWVVRRKLFEAALKGIKDGEAGIVSAAKEMGIKVDYLAKENGFELSTPLTKEGKVEKLSFGGGYRRAK